MDEIEKVDGVETENTAEVAEVETDKTAETEADSKDEVVEKPKETDEARRGRLQREITKLNKKLGVDEKPTKSKKSDELDYAKLAFHNSKSNSLKIESDEEMEFVKQQMDETGKSLGELLGTRYFQSEYKAYKDSKVVDDSVPSNKGRGAQTSTSKSVEFWMSKGEELPASTPENQKLILDIIDARIARAKGL